MLTICIAIALAIVSLIDKELLDISPFILMMSLLLDAMLLLLYLPMIFGMIK